MHLSAGAAPPFALGPVSRRLRLFDDFVRKDPRPARYAEGSFAFLNRIDDPFFATVRQLMEDWFAHYPAEHQHELSAKFRRDEQREMVSAFWELYLFELHRRLGFRVTVHPQVPGTTKRPDFRMDSHDHAFYLEAAVAAHSDEEAAQRFREALVLDMINDCRNADFSLSVDWKKIGRSTPRREEVIGRIEAWLASLDWRTERTRLVPYTWDDPRPLPVPTRVIEFGDWAVSLTAFPRKTRDAGSDRRLIGSPPVRGGAVDDITPLLGTLKGKSSRYATPDLRYVIAFGLMLDFAEFDDLEQALFGPETFATTRTDTNQKPQMVISREPNGLWQRGREHRGTRVSAVLALQSPSMYSLTAAEPSVWVNPGRRSPWATSTPSPPSAPSCSRISCGGRPERSLPTRHSDLGMTGRASGRSLRSETRLAVGSSETKLRRARLPGMDRRLSPVVECRHRDSPAEPARTQKAGVREFELRFRDQPFGDAVDRRLMTLVQLVSQVMRPRPLPLAEEKQSLRPALRRTVKTSGPGDLSASSPGTTSVRAGTSSALASPASSEGAAAQRWARRLALKSVEVV